MLWDKACEGDEAAIEQIQDMNFEFRIGFCYEFGSDIVPQDINKAKEWFERAVLKGHPAAMAHLAHILSEEKTTDGSRVVELYTKSADLGCSIAQYHLGLLYKEGRYVEKDMTKAVSLFERCAEQDDKEWCVADAAKELSEYYAESDPDKAFKYFSKYFGI